MSDAGDGRVLIVCAIRLEFNRFCKSLQGVRRHRDGDLNWAVGRFGHVPVVVCLTGVGESGVSSRLPQMLAQFPVRLAIVAGLCGGLSSDAPLGRACCPRFLRHIDQLDEINQPLADAVDLPTCTALVTVREAVTSIEEKQRLHAETGASLVDMEAYAVARILHQAGVPWLVIKSVSDDARMAIDPRISQLLQPDGSVKWNALFWELLTHPSLVRELKQLGKSSHAAMKTLIQAVREVIAREAAPV